MRDGRPWKNEHIEKKVIQNHTSWGPEQCRIDCANAGYQEVSLKDYLIDTPWGKKPKMFLYVGEKKRLSI